MVNCKIKINYKKNLSFFVDEKFLTKIQKESKMQNKLEVKKIRKKTLQEWLPIQIIYEDGIVKTKDNRLIKIIKINPINYNLKSDLEKEAILNSYKIFLKTCNFDIQILIQSNKRDLTPHIKNIQKNISQKENKYLKEIAKEYINYINKINLNRKSASKDFFIIISNKINSKKDSFNSEEILKNDLKEKYFKIKECLSRSGNSVFEISTKQEIEKIFFSFLNTKKYLNKKV